MSIDLSPEGLDRLEEMANAAKEGPWREDATGCGWVLHPDGSKTRCPSTPTAAFIASCRDAVPALVAEIRTLRAILGRHPRGSHD